MSIRLMRIERVGALVFICEATTAIVSKGDTAGAVGQTEGMTDTQSAFNNTSDHASTSAAPEHESSRSTTSRIVVGIDGSETSIEALRRAAGIARALGAPLEAIAVWHVPVSMYDVYSPEPGWSPDQEAATMLAETAEKVFGSELPEWFTAVTAPGTPAKVLIEASKDAEMLVVGSRGHGGFVGLLLGSVSSACVAHAHSPVLIVRPEVAAAASD